MAAPLTPSVDGTTLPNTVQQAIATMPQDKAARSYTVRLRMVEGEGTTSEKVLTSPVVAVVEGSTASIGMHESRPFVTGIRKSNDGMAEPIITVLKEGTQIEVRVTSLSKGRVQLDATVEMATIDGQQVVESPFQTAEERQTQLQAPEVNSRSRRVVRAVQLGETVKINCACACASSGKQETVMMLTVEEVGAPTPGITPITKVTATEELQEGELYQQVYPVGDLIEPYAVHKEGAAVEAADFLPVIDMLLTESGCDWPAKAQIRPFEEQHSVVISQTREGHEAIAKYLAAKRASVAEIEANLLRK